MLDENKFNELKKEYKNILEKLASPELISDFRKLEELSKKESHIKKIIEKNEELIGAKKNISENENIITSNEDEELTKIAEEEINQDNEKIKILEEELKTILEGSKEKIGEIIMEIRPGAGGEESALFAKKIFDMYARFAENKNWKITILSATETNLRGLKEIIFNVKNGNVFDILKYEAGVHRVQRIPETEKSGRTHTSTVTVAILPKAKDEELEIKPQDLRIDTYRASGPGGQYVNKRESAVRITHMPTGIAVASQTS
ncbi:TPA: peptide chain release factor 1, partial [Patescibacteria group bacterium]|nr:peptide chain release factor 1 [Patescibacteria group bacterium]